MPDPTKLLCEASNNGLLPEECAELARTLQEKAATCLKTPRICNVPQEYMLRKCSFQGALRSSGRTRRERLPSHSPTVGVRNFFLFTFRRGRLEVQGKLFETAVSPQPVHFFAQCISGSDTGTANRLCSSSYMSQASLSVHRPILQFHTQARYTQFPQ